MQRPSRATGSAFLVERPGSIEAVWIDLNHRVERGTKLVNGRNVLKIQHYQLLG